MTLGATRHRLVDPDLPGVAALLEPRPAPLEAAFAVAGSSLEEATPIQVTWWPGRQLAIRYRIEATGGGLAGSQQAVAVLGKIPEDAALVESDDAVAGVWVLPNDPSLPGLRAALNHEAVTSLLRGLGSDEEVGKVRLRAYRPGRRAVVEVVAGESSLFLKVLPPAKAKRLHRRHRHLAAHLPVPDSLGFDPASGIVVMRSLPGRNLRTALRRGGAFPDAAALAGLVANLPQPISNGKSPSPIEEVPAVAGLLRRLLPDESPRVDHIAKRIGGETREANIPVHGDFHEAQIIVVGNSPVGLLDVDTYGWGRPGDDPATMLAHLHLLAPSSVDPRPVLGLARDLQHIWDARVDPVDLRRRVAAVAMGLATGPFRVQSSNWPGEVAARLAVAERWVDSADRVDERSLMPVSGASHLDHRP